MFLECFIRFAIETTIINKNAFYGYLILNCSFTSIVWLIGIYLLYIESCKALPSIPTRGHGLVLLIFWTLSFIIETSAFISFKSNEWFWRIESTSDKIRFTLWIIRFTSTLMLVILGYYAPGIPSRRYSLIFTNQDSNDTNKTSWELFKIILKVIYSFVWTRKEWTLHLCAVGTVILVVFQRITVFLIPVYSKIISKLTKKYIFYSIF
jgi:ATP-binding cassette, subfamily B (MDR/TAP), member 6